MDSEWKQQCGRLVYQKERSGCDTAADLQNESGTDGEQKGSGGTAKASKKDDCSLSDGIPCMRKDGRYGQKGKPVLDRRDYIAHRVESSQNSVEDRTKNDVDKDTKKVFNTTDVSRKRRRREENKPISELEKGGYKGLEGPRVDLSFFEERRSGISLRQSGTSAENSHIEHAHNGRSISAVHRQGGFWPEMTQSISSGGSEELGSELVLKWMQEVEGTTNTRDGGTFEVEVLGNGKLSAEGDNKEGLSDHSTVNLHSFPLYVPKMHTIDMPHWLKQRRSMSWLYDAKQYEELLRKVCRNHRQVYKNEQMGKFVQEILDSGIISPAKKADIRCWCKVWPLLEEAKKRYRLIIDPALLNKMIKQRWSEFNTGTKFSTLSELRANVVQGETIVAFDFKCFYYQIQLDPTVRLFFGIRIGRKSFVLNRLAMGFSMAVAVAQDISQAAVQEVLRRSKIFCRWSVQVDNIYFFCAKADAAIIISTMNEVCREWKITIGSQDEYVKGIVLGAEYCCQSKTVQLSTKFHHKHMELLQKFDQLSHTAVPVAVFWRVVAILLRTLHVLGRPLCFYFFVMQAIRRIAAKLYDKEDETDWSSLMVLRDVEVRQLHEMFYIFVQNSTAPCRLLPNVTDEVVFSDASETHYGVVLVNETSITVGSKQWSKEEKEMHIGELEARALQAAVKRAVALHMKIPTFVVDATALCSAVRRGLSKNVHLNATIATLRGRFPNAKILWIESRWNPADAPSRGQQVTMLSINKGLEWVYEDYWDEHTPLTPNEL